MSCDWEALRLSALRKNKLPTELVNGRWQAPSEYGDVDAVVTYGTEPSAETGHCGWMYWALGTMGEAFSYEEAKKKAEDIVAKKKSRREMTDRYLVKVYVPYHRRWKYVSIGQPVKSQCDAVKLSLDDAKFYIKVRLSHAKTKVVRIVPRGTLAPQKWGVRRKSDGKMLSFDDVIGTGHAKVYTTTIVVLARSVARSKVGVIVRLKRERVKK